MEKLLLIQLFLLPLILNLWKKQAIKRAADIGLPHQMQPAIRRRQLI